MTATQTNFEAARRALAQRLWAVCPILLGEERPDDPGADAGSILERVVAAVTAQLTPDRMWLLLVAATGVYPSMDLVDAGLRAFELTDRIGAAAWVLETCLTESRAAGATEREIDLVVGGVCVDVDQAARHDYHTGIQQVIRQTMPLWNRDHEIVLTAWTQFDQAMRTVTPTESDRVLRWHGIPDNLRPDVEDPDGDHVIVVPWRSVVVISDVPRPSALQRLASMARQSGNSVVAIGYDCIPVVNSHLVPVGAAERTARNLAVVKHMKRVAGISVSAAVEFQGLVDALPAQGLRGPVVVECQLPAEQVALDHVAVRPPAERPLVLSVGSLEPRKNHLALLHAAETLWREGHGFDLTLIGGSFWSEELSGKIDEMLAAGRPLEICLRVSQEVLETTYARARFTVFPSLHEGYGLPVAESLAFGVPVITSNFGSTAEIADGGGVVTVDPRDDLALTAAIRTLLTDDAALDQLRREIVRRPSRTWQDYADELWDCLVRPELELVT